MPIATLNDEPVTVRLETAPPDGFVTIKRMSYGQSLRMQEVAAQMHTSNDGDKGQRQFRVEAGIMLSQLYIFKCCLIDHNLTDASGKKLDLQKEAGLAALDTTVGAEIQDLCEKLNAGEDMAPFLVQSGSTSTTDSQAKSTAQSSL